MSFKSENIDEIESWLIKSENSFIYKKNRWKVMGLGLLVFNLVLFIMTGHK
jgi:hypothetical protein